MLKIGRKFLLVEIDRVFNDYANVVLILNNCVKRYIPLLKFGRLCDVCICEGRP